MFIKEQSVQERIEVDGPDLEAMHVLANKMITGNYICKLLLGINLMVMLSVANGATFKYNRMPDSAQGTFMTIPGGFRLAMKKTPGSKNFVEAITKPNVDIKRGGKIRFCWRGGKGNQKTVFGFFFNLRNIKTGKNQFKICRIGSADGTEWQTKTLEFNRIFKAALDNSKILSARLVLNAGDNPNDDSSIEIKDFVVIYDAPRDLNYNFNKNEIPLRIIPTPREMKITSTRTFIPRAGLNIFSSDKKVADMLVRELEYLGLKASSSSIISGPSHKFVLQLTSDKKGPGTNNWPAFPAKKQGYHLATTDSGATITASDRRGLYNGVNSLLQILEQSLKFKRPVPVVSINDWPDFEFRAFHMPFYRPSVLKDDMSDADIEKATKIYETFFRRLSRYKYTHVFLMMSANMELRKYHDMWAPIYSQNDVKKIVAIAKGLGLKVIPHIHTLSAFVKKSNPQYLRIRSRLEPMLEPEVMPAKGQRHVAGGKSTLRVRNKEVMSMIKSILDEVIEVFDHPEIVHLGGDEAAFFATSQPAGMDRGRLFADYFNELNNYVKSKGSRAMIWYDMLISCQDPIFSNIPARIRPGNGGPPLNTAGAVKYLDKDIMIAIWHYGYSSPDRYPTIEWFRKKGFNDVISCSWFRNKDALVLAKDTWKDGGIGFMGSAWALSWQLRYEMGSFIKKRPKAQKDLAMKRQFAPFPVVAEISWNPEDAVAMQPWDERELKGNDDPYTWVKIWMSEIIPPAVITE